MKLLLARLGVVLVGILIFGCAELWAEDWMYYGRTDKYLCSYDLKSINHPTENIVEVSEKQDYTKEGVKFAVEQLGRKYENLSHLITSWQINCADRKFRFLSLTYYSKDQTIIYSWKLLYSSGHPEEWSLFSAGSVGEKLYESVCK